jgi:hypothetical protein
MSRKAARTERKAQRDIAREARNAARVARSERRAKGEGFFGPQGAFKNVLNAASDIFGTGSAIDFSAVGENPNMSQEGVRASKFSLGKIGKIPMLLLGGIAIALIFRMFSGNTSNNRARKRSNSAF